MEEIINTLIENIQLFVLNSNIFLSIFIGFLIIILESIIPALPLSVFIAINTIAFGNVVGFIISYIGTIIGCMLSYYVFKKIRLWLYEKMYKKLKFINFIERINDLNFIGLVLVLALPFTPAFSINIAAGLSNMEYKKYLLALIISKLFAVYFWGFVATTFFESVTDITVIIKMVVLMIIAYVLSKIAMKKFNL